jgi:hypothetical protein
VLHLHHTVSIFPRDLTPSRPTWRFGFAIYLGAGLLGPIGWHGATLPYTVFSLSNAQLHQIHTCSKVRVLLPDRTWWLMCSFHGSTICIAHSLLGRTAHVRAERIWRSRWYADLALLEHHCLFCVKGS